MLACDIELQVEARLERQRPRLAFRLAGRRRLPDTHRRGGSEHYERAQAEGDGFQSGTS